MLAVAPVAGWWESMAPGGWASSLPCPTRDGGWAGGNQCPRSVQICPGRVSGAVEVAGGAGGMGSSQTSIWGETCLAPGRVLGDMSLPRLTPTGDSEEDTSGVCGHVEEV